VAGWLGVKSNQRDCLAQSEKKEQDLTLKIGRIFFYIAALSLCQTIS
jgi:hypothetical protein